MNNNCECKFCLEHKKGDTLYDLKSYDIEYCPKCGKKLLSDEDKHKNELKLEIEEYLLNNNFIKNIADKLFKEFKNKMRDATEEERKSVRDYIESISQDTGVNFFDFLNKDKENKNIEPLYPGKIVCNGKEFGLGCECGESWFNDDLKNIDTFIDVDWNWRFKNLKITRCKRCNRLLIIPDTIIEDMNKK